jgi:hypothetical protein
METFAPKPIESKAGWGIGDIWNAFGSRFRSSSKLTMGRRISGWKVGFSGSNKSSRLEIIS